MKEVATDGEPVTASTNSGIGPKEIDRSPRAAHNDYRTVGKVSPGHTMVKRLFVL